jgi:hypothetical protein
VLSPTVLPSTVLQLVPTLLRGFKAVHPDRTLRKSKRWAAGEGAAAAVSQAMAMLCSFCHFF